MCFKDVDVWGEGRVYTVHYFHKAITISQFKPVQWNNFLLFFFSTMGILILVLIHLGLNSTLRIDRLILSKNI